MIKVLQVHHAPVCTWLLELRSDTEVDQSIFDYAVPIEELR